VIVVGALIASAGRGAQVRNGLGWFAVALASVNIFGGFSVTARMLAMYKKRERRMHEAAATPAWVLLAYLISGSASSSR